MKSSYDWSRFVKRVNLRATTQDVYKAWATQDGLESWFLRVAEFRNESGELRKRGQFIEPGDQYKWHWHGYDDTVVEEKQVLEANGRDRLVFSFSGNCVVTVSIIEEGGELVCELQQYMPMADEAGRRYYFIECGKGWTFYLANLKSILEGGIDLRNKNQSLAKVINA